MRNHVSHLTVAILTAAIAVACTGRNDQVNNDRRQQSGARRGVNERLALKGCVAPAPDNQYVLRYVEEVPPAEQPQGQERMEHATLVPRGSWVRLTSGGDDLKNHLGKRVLVTGEIRDPGGNTIGTAGQSSPMPRAGESNSMPPLLAVERVTEAEGSELCTQGEAGRSR